MNWRDKLLLIAISLICSAIYVSANTCMDIPLTNSTIVTNNRVITSVNLNFNVRELPKICTVNAFGDDFKISVVSWANKFSLDCYETDDPIDAKNNQVFNNGVLFEDSSICYCHNILRTKPECKKNLCRGNLQCIDRIHESQKCTITPKGSGNWVHKEKCFYGFNRFKVCKVNVDEDFEMNYLVDRLALNDTDYLLQHTGEKSVTGSLDKVRLTTIIDYDSSFEGKYVVLDSKSTEKFWLVDSNKVNDKDERDIRKIGWFRKEDDDFHLEMINKQLTPNIDSCSQDRVDIFETPLEIAKFLDDNKVFDFSNIGYGKVISNKNEVYYSDGRSNAEFDEYTVLEKGFMAKDIGGVVRFVGIGLNGVINSNEVDSSGDDNTFAKSTCGPSIIVEDYTRYMYRFVGEPKPELSNSPRDILVIVNKFSSIIDSKRKDCFSTIILNNGDLQVCERFKLWPTEEMYKCCIDETGMPLCTRDVDPKEERSFTFFSYSDKSKVDLFVQTESVIKTEELIYPNIEGPEIICKENICNFLTKSYTGSRTTIRFDDCFNDIIYEKGSHLLYAYSDCKKVIRVTGEFQGKEIMNALFRVEAIKNTNIPIVSPRNKPEGKNEIDIDWLLIFLEYWYVYVIAVVVIVCLILFVVFYYYYYQKKIVSKVISIGRTRFAEDKKMN